MIPLRDNVRPKKFPFINIFLIIVNVLIFFYQTTLTREELLQLFVHYGVIPQQFFELSGSGALLPAAWFPFISATFLHEAVPHATLYLVSECRKAGLAVTSFILAQPRGVWHIL